MQGMPLRAYFVTTEGVYPDMYGVDYIKER